MSIFKLGLQLAIWYAVGLVVPKILAPFVGREMANYILWGLVLLYIVGSFLAMRYFSKQGHRNTKIFPATSDIPKSLAKKVTELEQLGFRQIGFMKHHIPMLIKEEAFVYTNKSRNIIAYARPQNGGLITFTCYLADGFDVSTNYPNGANSDSEKIVHRIVKSNLQTAFDYHKHHVKSHMQAHGIPKQFKSLREILDWEDKQSYLEDSHKTGTKAGGRLWLRVILALVIAPIIGGLFLVPLYVYFIFQGLSFDNNMVAIATGVIPFATTIIGLLWAYRPLYRPETVEDRKKKELA